MKLSATRHRIATRRYFLDRLRIFVPGSASLPRSERRGWPPSSAVTDRLRTTNSKARNDSGVDFGFSGSSGIEDGMLDHVEYEAMERIR